MRKRCGELQAEKKERDAHSFAEKMCLSLLSRLQGADRRYRLLAGVRTVLVACSGGPDSVALLHLLWSRREYLGLRLGVAHLHHGLRGAEAEADAAYVADLAQRLDLPLLFEKADVPRLAAERRLSPEVAARQARYEFLARLAEAGGWERVALGHTASDRAETVLLNLLRGAGLHGLRGIPPRQGLFIRPLILATREETAAYCAHFHLEPRLDSTNLDLEQAQRNRVRLELLPRLREYNPAVEEALLRLAEAAEAELEWTEPQVQAAAERVIHEGPGRVSLDLTALQEAPSGLRYRLFREAWVRLTGDPFDLSAADYAALEHLLRESQTGRQVCLPRDIQAQKGYNQLTLRREQAGEARRPWPARELPTEGALVLPEISRTVVVERLAEPPSELGDARGCQIVVDAARVRLPLQVRPWQAGDALVPLGMHGHKKVQDLFTDLKVPADQRGLVPLVCDADGEIVWVVGCAMSERGRITEGSREFLRIVVRE